MKLAVTGAVCVAMMFGTIGCGDEDESTVWKMTVAQCEQAFDKVISCGVLDVFGEGELTAEMSEQLCSVTVPLTNCMLKEYSSACRDAYARYSDCFYSLDSCEEIQGMYDMTSYYDSEDFSDRPCSEDEKNYFETCQDDFYVDQAKNECADEYQAYSDVTDSLFGYDTDYSTDESDDTDWGTDDNSDTAR